MIEDFNFIPVRHLKGFASPPLLPVTLTLTHPDLGDRPVFWTTSKEAYKRAVGAGQVCWTPAEVVTLCRLVEADRASPARFVEWCQAKARSPSRRLTLDIACPGVTVPQLGPRPGVYFREVEQSDGTSVLFLAHLVGAKITRISIDGPN